MSVIKQFGHWEISLVTIDHVILMDDARLSAGDGSDLRDYVVKCGIIPPLLALVKPNAPVRLVQLVTYMCCDGNYDRLKI